MTNYIAILLLLLAFSAAAADVPLAWDPVAGATNYVLYATTDTTNVIRVDTGTNTTATLSDIRPGLWSFQVCGQADGLEGQKCDPLLAQVCQPPARMRTFVLQYTAALPEFKDGAFFRIKMEPTNQP